MTQAAMSFTLPPYRQIITHVDTDRRAVWCYFNPLPRPTITKILLEDCKDLQNRVKTHLSLKEEYQAVQKALELTEL